LEPDFYVPPAALIEFRTCVERGARYEAEWTRKFDEYAKQQPQKTAELKQMLAGELPAGWDSDLPTFTAKDNLATRESAAKVENAIAMKVPALFGGSADLNESTFTDIKDGGDFERNSYAGRNLHFGIREHAMCSTLNGIALSGGFIPFGSSFFVFTDYCRPSIRLAALMSLHVVYLFTHDSIGLGEDGPTHQPIEHLTSLRAMPNLVVIRPADATEAVEAWRVAMQRKDGPVMLVLSRQKVPTIDRTTMAPASNLQRGAYVLTETQGRVPDVLLIATGSEVQLAIGAKPELEKQGMAVRVVSMPSFELFQAQSQDYQKSVLPPEIERRVAIEAAATLSWHRWVGPKGDIIGIDRYGASAPSAELMKHFGFTVENVVNRTLKLAAR
jgi:transketolase